MKLFRISNSIAIAITVVGALGSCQDPHHEPIDAKQNSEFSVNDKAAKKSVTYYLMKDGDVRLIYQAQARNRLTKQSEGTKGCYWEYKYQPNKILGVHKTANDQMLTTRTFKLNDQGLCIESTHNSKNWQYEYFPKGYLKKCYNTDHPNERMEFEYWVGPDGYNLRYVQIYNQLNFREKEIFINYSMTPDPCSVNPDYLPNGAGKYLPIFGKFNVYLPEELIETSYYSNGWALVNEYLYSYTMGANGLPKTITLKGKYNNEIKDQINRVFSSHPEGL